MNGNGFKPLTEIKKALKELSLEVFGSERVLSYEYFRTQAFAYISLSDIEYEMTTGRTKLIEKLEQGLETLIKALVVTENQVRHQLSEQEVMERNAVAAKMTFKRALYLVRLDRFCDAALTTAFAAYYLIESSPSLKEDPYLVVHPTHIMALGLLEETLTSYMDPEKYTASDCKSSCGYCQDPLTTVAKYCTDALEELSASGSTIKEIWTTAAAMLGAYAAVRGADLESMRFPQGFPQKAKVALKLILYHEKTDHKSYMELVNRYVEKLKICRMSYLSGQYEDQGIPWQT